LAISRSPSEGPTSNPGDSERAIREMLLAGAVLIRLEGIVE